MRSPSFIAMLLLAPFLLAQTSPPATRPATAPATAPASPEARARAARTPINLLDKLVRQGTTLSVKTPDGVQISANGDKGLSTLQSEDTFKAPLVITAIARTGDGSIRLYAGDKGVVILNWENNGNELRHHDPRTGEQSGVPNKGAVKKNAFVTIRWTLDERSSRIEVDGTERVAFPGDFSSLSGTVGIGTYEKNAVTVKSFQVTLVPEKTGPTVATGALPTIKDITDLMDAKKYAPALPLVTRLLDLKGPQAAAFNRNQLFMLRAECLIQLRQTDAALATLAAARKEADTSQKRYEVIAFAELIQKSPAAKYTSTGTPKTTMDLLDRDKRKDLYVALWTDLQKPLEPTIAKAVEGAALPALGQAGRAATIARSVEYMATGKTETTDKLAQQVRDRTVNLIDNSLKDMSGRVKEIFESADTTLRLVNGAGQTLSERKRGLEGNQSAQLEGVEHDCLQLISFLEDFAGLYPDDGSLRDRAKNARDVGTRAYDVRTRHYN